MAVKEFVGGAGNFFSSAWTDGSNASYPSPGDQMVIHSGGNGLVWAMNSDLGAYYINIGSNAQYTSTFSMGNSAANVYNDWLTGPTDSQNEAGNYRAGNISAWGQYDVLNLGDHTYGGGIQNIVTTAGGTMLYFNQQTVGGNQDTVYLNGGGYLSNYGASTLYRSDDIISIPDVGNGLWMMNNSRMEFQNNYVAPSVAFEVNGSSDLEIDSPTSNTLSQFHGQIYSEAFTNSLIGFNGPVFDQAAYSNGVLTLSKGDFQQTFNVDLHTNGGGPQAAWSVWQTYSGVAIASGSEKPQAAVGNPIFSYNPQNS